MASPATIPDGEALSAVPAALGELAAAAPATNGGLPRRRLAGGFPVASAVKARIDPEELLAAAATDDAGAAPAATDRRGARGSAAAELPLPLPPSPAEVTFVSRSGTRSKMDLRKSNVSSAWTVDLRWAGVSVLARREDATPAACVSKSCKSISSALPTRTGVAVATLPTSSSACIIFLMRDGGKAAVDDLRRPMAGDPSVDTPDRAERAFTR